MSQNVTSDDFQQSLLFLFLSEPCAVTLHLFYAPSTLLSRYDLVSITAGNSLCKYADDTYVIIPASNHLSRSAELDNI